MKAITIWQPWASLIAIEAKTFETRGWPTEYRGPIAIHAAAKPTKSVIETLPIDVRHEMVQHLSQHYQARSVFEALPLGCVVATADLIDCHKIVRYDSSGAVSNGQGWLVINDLVYFPPDSEYLFGDWTPGRYAWDFANVRMLEQPVPASGKQGLWNWKPTV